MVAKLSNGRCPNKSHKSPSGRCVKNKSASKSPKASSPKRRRSGSKRRSPSKRRRSSRRRYSPRFVPSMVYGSNENKALEILQDMPALLAEDTKKVVETALNAVGQTLQDPVKAVMEAPATVAKLVTEIASLPVALVNAVVPTPTAPPLSLPPLSEMELKQAEQERYFGNGEENETPRERGLLGNIVNTLTLGLIGGKKHRKRRSRSRSRKSPQKKKKIKIAPCMKEYLDTDENPGTWKKFIHRPTILKIAKKWCDTQ